MQSIERASLCSLPCRRYPFPVTERLRGVCVTDRGWLLPDAVSPWLRRLRRGWFLRPMWRPRPASSTTNQGAHQSRKASKGSPDPLRAILNRPRHEVKRRGIELTAQNRQHTIKLRGLAGPGFARGGRFLPLYEYECTACKQRFELLQKFSDKPAKVCVRCGAPVVKLLSSPSIQFKGTGWYVTDYGKSGANQERKKAESSESPKEKTPAASQDSSAKESSGNSAKTPKP
jgi:putative FmdB family regulatory protein